MAKQSSTPAYVVKAWGEERAALIWSRRRPPLGSDEHLSELRASLAMTNAMARRWANWLTGSSPAVVTWMPKTRRRA